jgi:periplasmic divalent cation tolerance protein
MPTECIIVFCNCPNLKTAETLAELLIENQLAACVNIIPTIHSVFYWEGKLEKTDEAMLIIKTMQTHYLALEVMIQKHHPYEIPEIISVSIKEGQRDYLAFIQKALEP